tara:strand:+ start:1587 stop:2003 length:417 start_codon:yes stop_codon:yes gene_type:complete
MITPEKFGKILNKLPKEKTELSNLEKVELKLIQLDYFLKESQRAEKLLQKKERALVELRKLAIKEAKETEGGISLADAVQKGLFKAGSEAEKLKNQLKAAGVDSGELNTKLKQIEKGVNSNGKLQVAFANLVSKFERI